MPKLSAGILPFKVSPDRSIEVLLVHPGGPFWAQKQNHAWSVAKGEYAPGDNPESAAEREFREELGSPVPDGERLDLGEIRQSGGKRVRVWAVEVEDFPVDTVISNRFEIEWPPRSGRIQSFPEVDRAQWVPVERARDLLVRAQTAFIDRLIERYSQHRSGQ